MKRVFAWRVIFLIPLIIVLSRSYAVPVVSVKIASNKAMQKKGQRYEFETAIIEMLRTVVNQAMEIKETITLYIKDHGNRQVRHSHEIRNIKIINQTEETEQVSITERGWITSYNPKKKDGIRMKDPYNESFGQMTEAQKEQFAKGITDAFGATTRIIGTETIAGKQCAVTETVTELGGMKSVTKEWRWKNFVLKTHSTGMGMETLELATSVREGIPIDETLFLVPDSISITSIDPFKY